MFEVSHLLSSSTSSDQKRVDGICVYGAYQLVCWIEKGSPGRQWQSSNLNNNSISGLCLEESIQPHEYRTGPSLYLSQVDVSK